MTGRCKRPCEVVFFASYPCVDSVWANCLILGKKCYQVQFQPHTFLFEMNLTIEEISLGFKFQEMFSLF